jgi:NADH dehydrogenase
VRVLILGGGFGGAYAARTLERLLAERDDVQVSLVNRDNYLVFQPLLAEVVSGDLGVHDTVTPLRRLVPRTQLFVRQVTSVDLEARTVTLAPSFRPREVVLEWDRLILGLGSVPALSARPGFAEHALAFRTLADAVRLRNHLIRVLEQAAIEDDPRARATLLTVVVAGGGFSGTELAAAINDFMREALSAFRSRISRQELRVVLVHASEHVLDREVSPRLAKYATRALARTGVELQLGVRADEATPECVVLTDGRTIGTRTFITTVPSAPSPVVTSLELPLEQGRLKVDSTLQVEGRDDVWAIGDSAAVPSPEGKDLCPTTAQYAIREADIAAENVLASIDGTPQQTFVFTGLGKLGALGRRRAVAELPGGVRLAGLPAWLAWRAVYWSKLPGLDRKLKVGASWLMDLVVPTEITQLELGGSAGVDRIHHQAGDTVFRQGDLGDRLYMIVSGEVEVLSDSGGAMERLAVLGPGEYFGEMALLGRGIRGATVRCLSPTQLLALPASDFGALIAGLPGLRHEFEDMAAVRARRHDAATERPQGGPD